MNGTEASRPTASLLVLALLYTTQHAHGQCQYEATAIQGPACSTGSIPPTSARAVNEHGVVVGSFEICPIGPNRRAFVWSAKDGFLALDHPPGATGSHAYDINSRGQVTVTAGYRAFIWEDGQYTELEPALDAECNLPSSINRDGQVAGYYNEESASCHPQSGYLWTPGEGHFILGMIDGRPTFPRAITDTGHVGGHYGSLANDDRPFLWRDGQLELLGLFPGSKTTGVSGMNESDQLVGWAVMKRDEQQQPILWDDGKWIGLGVLDGCDHGYATDINNLGQVVGRCWTPDSQRIPFIWQLGEMHDLRSLSSVPTGYQLREAKGITDNGLIVADGFSPSLLTASFLLVPTFPHGDIDHDCHVGFVDLLVLLSDWSSMDSPADLTGDGVVDLHDLEELLASWG